MKARIIKTHIIATEGARTANGGVIQCASGAVKGVPHNVVRYGDIAIYPDGTAARVVSGGGAFYLDRGLPVAVVGSALSNGDVITESPYSKRAFYQMEGQPVDGLLEPGWHRFASGARDKVE